MLQATQVGSDGQVCVTDVTGYSAAFVRLLRHGVYFSDDDNPRLAHQGQRLYVFALASYKAYTG